MLDKNGLTRELKQFNKEAFYYQQKMNEYKSALADPKKLEQQFIEIVKQQPAFRDFMAKNSQLAELFRIPGSGGSNTEELPEGLQTRAGIEQDLSGRMGTSVNPQQMIQNEVQKAQIELNKVKDKINQLGGTNSDIIMPGFKPNQQKSKTFWKRLEYGLNVQSQKANSLLPVTSDLALTVGYKLNDKSVIGIGTGYKLGWGKSLSNISFSSQGMSLRSYLDTKLKGSFWISGGYELNYLSEFNKLTQLQNMDAWQKSGLIGVTKKYKISKKTGSLQLLWDFLSYRQVPQSQPLKFRIGYLL